MPSAILYSASTLDIISPSAVAVVFFYAELDHVVVHQAQLALHRRAVFLADHRRQRLGDPQPRLIKQAAKKAA